MNKTNDNHTTDHHLAQLSDWQPSAGRMLTRDEARTIYQVKVSGKSAHDASRLGEYYRVTPKTIRDIWIHRTWVHATVPLWTLVQVNAHVYKKLCADCRAAGITFENGTACDKCIRFVCKMKEYRAGDIAPQNNGAAATALPTINGDESNDSAGASLRHRGWNQIWHRQNGLHGGLLQEALGHI